VNILIICNWGKNRSAYLAKYLEQKGYSVKYGGIFKESDNPIIQDKVDWSDILVFVQPQTKKYFKKLFQVGDQKIIVLDVEDRMSFLAPEKENLSPEEWTQIQKEKVYPELEKQIDQYLPFK